MAWFTDSSPSKTIQHQLNQGNTISMTKVVTLWLGDLGAWFPVHGPRQNSAGTAGQVSCSEMGSVLSLDEATKLPCPTQVSLI